MSQTISAPGQSPAPEPPKNPGTPDSQASALAKWVPAPAGQQFLSMVLYMAGFAVFFLLANLLVVSPLEHYATQHKLYSELRLSLAEGSAPVNSLTIKGTPTKAGTPIAVMKAPKIGIGQEVIVEGSGAAQTAQGIAHRRDTVYPCQIGSSVLMARDGAYGGVGEKWKKLQPGATFSITMGQGSCTYRVLDQRQEGDFAPAPPTGTQGRLVLTTATGLPFMPTGVTRVDAQLVTDGFKHAETSVPSAAVPATEQAMGSQLRAAIKGDSGIDLATPFGMILLLEVLVAAGIGAAWAWKRWGRWDTWIVATPVIFTVGLLIARSATIWFLPNLV